LSMSSLSSTLGKGLTLVNSSTQSKHFLWDTFGGVSDETGTG
jgi:hypothetical protein